MRKISELICRIYLLNIYIFFFMIISFHSLKSHINMLNQFHVSCLSVIDKPLLFASQHARLVRQVPQVQGPYELTQKTVNFLNTLLLALLLLGHEIFVTMTVSKHFEIRQQWSSYGRTMIRGLCDLKRSK